LAFVAVVLLALGAIGSVAARDLASEGAQAGALVSLGRTALAKGDPATATLSFERARLLAPRADLVRSALSGAGVPSLGPFVTRAVGWVTPREWSSLSVGFGWMAGLSLAVAIVRGQKGRLARAAALCSGVAFVLSMGGVVESNLASRALAVVTQPAGILVAPYDAAGATADLHAGAVVVMGERYGDFVRVSGAGGVTGWVSSRALQSVVGAGT
jgi:hypothetical protein